jgi:HlyD family secretion protein
MAVLVAVLAAAAAAYAWWALHPMPVAMATVQRGVLPGQVTGPGTVQARVPVVVSPRFTSTVIGIAVDVGDAVKTGQLLVTLDDRDLAARRAAVGSQQVSLDRQVEAARAGVDRAQADLALARVRQRRDSDLQQQGFVSPAAVDASNAGLDVARAAVDSARATPAARLADAQSLAQEARVADAQLAYARLVSPMEGVVTQRLVEPGTTAAAGTPILRLVDPRTLWVATRVDESVVSTVELGQAATIRLRTGQTLRGRVARIGYESDTATRELDVHVAFEEMPARYAIGQEAQVHIDARHEEGLVLPAPALTRDGSGHQGVLKIVEGRARFVPVSAGSVREGRVLVRDGLSEGDRVVANAQGVRAGAPVEDDGSWPASLAVLPGKP